MKRTRGRNPNCSNHPAAFRRLCVETSDRFGRFGTVAPAAFRRLCVETKFNRDYIRVLDPAAFRRLCVETKMTV